MHEALVRWFCRLLAPRDPRGWLTVEAIYENGTPRRTVWVHCHGMERWELPNLEIVDVPIDLQDFAQEILLNVAGYMRGERAIRPGESFGGTLVSPSQRAHHQATLQPVDRPGDEAHDGMLRIVDLGETVDSGFPRRLFAVHVNSLAERAESLALCETMYRQSIALWPGDPAAAPSEGPFEPGSNENNFLAWEGLGDALCDRGRFDEGILYLEEAVARSPRWARELAEHIRTEVGPEVADPRFTFWSQLDVEEVRRRVVERRGRTRPSSAGKRLDDSGRPRKPR